MKKTIVSAMLLAFFAGGCAAFSDRPTAVILQNPQTMEFVDCKVDRWETDDSYAKNDKCVEDYKKQGYIVWGER